MDSLAQGAGTLTVDDRDGAELGHDGGVNVVVDHALGLERLIAADVKLRGRTARELNLRRGGLRPALCFFFFWISSAVSSRRTCPRFTVIFILPACSTSEPSAFTVSTSAARFTPGSST